MTMIDNKLDRGLDILADAANDLDLLGVALLAFQGAMADYLRELLATNASLGAAEQAVVADPQTSLAELVDIAQRSGDLTREQSWRILDTEKLCRSFAAGDEFRGSPREVRGYGRFVAELSGRSDIAQEVGRLASLPEGVAQKSARPIAGDGYGGLLRLLPGIVLIAALLVGAWWLFNRASRTPTEAEVAAQATALAETQAGAQATPGAQLADVATPTILAVETASPEAPTSALPPGTRQARIVRLGGGPGWLHETPAFDSPTLPPRLAEGQEVVALGQEQVDASGVPWVLVSAAGYQGWSPLNNVEYVTP